MMKLNYTKANKRCHCAKPLLKADQSKKSSSQLTQDTATTTAGLFGALTATKEGL